VFSGTAFFAAISKMSVSFEEVLTKDEEQEHFLKQNAALRPRNFTNVWLECEKMIALPWAGSNEIFSAISRMTGFSRDGDTRIARDCRLDTDDYAKTTSKVCKYSARHKRQCLPTVYIG